MLLLLSQILVVFHKIIDILIYTGRQLSLIHRCPKFRPLPKLLLTLSKFGIGLCSAELGVECRSKVVMFLVGFVEEADTLLRFLKIRITFVPHEILNGKFVGF